MDPNYASAYYSRALLYFGTLKYDLAWRDLSKAKELGHSIDPAFLGLLSQHSGRNEFEDATTLEGIVISGIFFDGGGKSSAIVANQVVFEGGTVNGVRIDKINKDSVEVSRNGRKANLKSAWKY